MPRYTTSQTYTDGNTQIVALPDPVEDGTIAEHKSLINPEAEPLELKLQRITEKVPVRVGNTSGSSAGSGSGDFHQYRQMRRKEQDRLARMEVDYRLKKEAAEFEARRKEMVRTQELRTAKKRAKRQKKKELKKLAKTARKTDKCDAGNARGARLEAITEEDEQSDDEDEEEEEEKDGGHGNAKTPRRETLV